MTMQEQKKQWKGYESTPIDLTAVHPQRPRITGYDEELEDDTLYPSRLPSSTRRYTPHDPQRQAVTRPGQQAVRTPNRYDEVNYYIRRRPRSQGNGPRQSAQNPTEERRATRQAETEPPDDDEPRTQPIRQNHRRAQVPRRTWSTWVGLGMVVVLLIWLVGALVLACWQGWQNDIHYGRPRTYQTDARVGHNDANTPSHFLALNLNGHVEVIEFPGGDATHAKVYQGPTLLGQDSDLDIVTVSFNDVNGDGKPDMIISVKDAKYPFINDNGAFRPPHTNEHINL